MGNIWLWWSNCERKCSISIDKNENDFSNLLKYNYDVVTLGRNSSIEGVHLDVRKGVRLVTYGWTDVMLWG